MRTEKGNEAEDGANQADSSDPGPSPGEEPPQQSAEPWRQAAVAWTHHAEAWAAQAEAAARNEAAARSEAAARNEAAARQAVGPEDAGERELWGRPEPDAWVAPSGGETLPARIAPQHVVPASASTDDGTPVGVAADDVDDLGEPAEPVTVSPWPDLGPDERSAHSHVWAPQRTRRRSWAPLAGAAAFVLCLATSSVAIWNWTRPEPMPLGAPPPPTLASAPAQPSVAAPTITSTALPEEGAASAPVRPGDSRTEQAGARPADKLATWAGALRLLDIPPVALQAYGYAEAVLAKAKPRCHLSWTLLAGIGAVESNHGRFGGATLQPDGTSSRPIIGVPLAGIGVERVRDTDGGTLDGDRDYDRAIGPMQFLPATWKAWSVDADDNGRADPYDIDDASLAAGYYLCAGGQDLATGSGWASAVYTYNRVPAYVERVYQFADAYGRAS